ncbi:turripeptide Gli9.1-like [Stomoxys calcitrans]|uniref:turripeptide Gli9.1-like n=1 Tax=Stomoxys calcitrans TaxID=35570 RepID=UPI0027E29689|nr:turripeptide Gli9.1-like [Stomoxys calcitrans]
MVSIKWIFTLALIFVLGIFNLVVAQATEDCPTVCPYILNPICATLSDGTKHFHPNPCDAASVACASKLKMVSYTPGNC